MTDKEAIRVLVVDDSLVCREMLSQILQSDPGISVVGQAKDGVEAIELAKALRPSLITMDIHMPKLDGVSATEEIMAYAPTPILVVSSSVRADQTGLAFDALAAGALEVLKKPEPRDWSELETLAGDLIAKVKLLAGVKVITHLKGRLRDMAVKREPVAYHVPHPERQIVAIGSSTGGPSALMEVLSALPREFEPAVIVAQHIADGFIPGLVEWLNSECRLPVVMASQGEPITGGRVLVAPTGGHLRASYGRCEVVPAQPTDTFRPSCNVLFESVAQSYHGHAIGVILTGMGADGAEGLKKLHDAGAYTIAQNEDTCVVYGMPKAAVDAGAVDVIAPLGKVADEILAGMEVRVP